MITSRGSGLAARVRARADHWARQTRVRRALRHIAGPTQVPGDDQDVTVITPIRNGAYYLDAFLAHHRALGARHFILCDNGSTDDTVAQLRAAPDVTLLSCDLPMKHYETDLRRTMAERYCSGRWVLFADADELFDFAGSAQIGLHGLTEYLDAHGFTALLAQMVEMFPEGPLASYAQADYDSVLEAYQFYDLSDARPVAYHDPSIDFSDLLRPNRLPSEAIRFYYGGVRARVFQENCCLTKHPLVHVRPGVKANTHPHCATGVAVADVTGLIRHYKFSNDPFARDAAAVRERRMAHGEDSLRSQIVSARPDLTLHGPHARRMQGIEELYDSGFLLRSRQYQHWVARR